MLTALAPADRAAQASSTPESGRAGRPRATQLLSEGVRSAIAHGLPTLVAAIVVAAGCAAVFATTGQAASAEQAVVSRIDSAGTRLIVVSDAGGEAGMSSQSVALLSSLPQVEWVLGLGPVVDVRAVGLSGNGGGTPARNVFGDVSRVLTLKTGREPLVGEALAGTGAAKQLHLGDGVGGVIAVPGTPGSPGYPVVGTFDMSDGVEALDSSVLVLGDSARAEHIYYIYTMAKSASEVEKLAGIIPSIVVAEQASHITVEQPAGLVELRALISADLNESGRRTMLMILGAGLALVMITMAGAVAGRRRDFGRRRALGASRSAIIVLVIVQALLAGMVGAVVGAASGLAVIQGLTGQLPSATFTIGVVGLAVLMALFGAIPPAVTAAVKDPVRILRIP